MRFNREWTEFWVDAEVDMFGTIRLVKDHNELRQLNLELERQNYAMSRALKGILNVDNPPWGEPGHVDFNTAIEMGRDAIKED